MIVGLLLASALGFTALDPQNTSVVAVIVAGAIGYLTPRVTAATNDAMS